MIECRIRVSRFEDIEGARNEVLSELKERLWKEVWKEAVEPDVDWDVRLLEGQGYEIIGKV